MQDSSPIMQVEGQAEAHVIRVQHKTITINGLQIFYREAGSVDRPLLLLPHGYPCSSYEFRNLMPALAKHWHLVAPDFPGFGYSDTPDSFDYSFGGYSQWLDRFCTELGLERFVLYLHDYGTWIGLRLAMEKPERVAGLVIQNGDIYEDTLGPKYAGLLEHFARPTAKTRSTLTEAISEQGFREEFLNDLDGDAALAIPPDMWQLHWSLMTPKRKEVALALMELLKENMTWFPQYQAFLRDRQLPTLICWGPKDGYMPAEAATAYVRDLPSAEVHLFNGGHWLLETHLDSVCTVLHRFLVRVYQVHRQA